MRRYACALACALGACGPSSFADFREQYISRHCAHAIKCGQLGPADEPACGLPADFALVQKGSLDLEASMVAGRMRFGGNAAQECLDAISSAPCDQAGFVARLYRHCQNIVQPRIAPGGACHANEECLGGFCALGNACPGACVAWPAPGASCGAGLPGCDPTVEYCGSATAGAPTTCLRKKLAGAPCAGDLECAFDLYCVASRCAPPWLPAGAACGSGVLVCGDGLTCAGGMCKPFAREGEPCSEPAACAPGTTCVNGVCRAWLVAGQACGTTGACPASYTCQGTCTAPAVAPKGRFRFSCDQMACASGLVCSSHKDCVYPAGIGGACATDGECASGLTCDAVLGACLGPYGACAP